MLSTNTLSRFTLLLLLILFAGCAKEKEVRRVLVIHSYEESYVAYPEFDKLIKDEFLRHDIDAELRFFYLDCESFQSQEEIKRIKHYLDSMTGWKPELILVNEDQATYSLLHSAHPLVKELPIVFAGVNYPNWELIKQYPNVTGFEDKIDFKTNVNVAKDLLGKDVRIFTILDSTYLDRQIRTDIYEQLKNEKVAGKLTNKFKSDFEKQGVDLREVTYFFPISVRGYGGGIFWGLSKYLSGNTCYVQAKRDFTTANMGNICQSPSMTTINEAFGYNERLLGGYFTSLPIQVKEEVGAAVRILHGAQPSDIPISESKKEYLVDWKVMQSLHMSKDQIPAKYTIIHMPLKVAHPWLWAGAIISGSSIIITIIIWLLFLYRREYKRKRNALYALEDEKETLALAIEGGNTFALKLQDNCFILEDTFWRTLGVPARRITLRQAALSVHPDYRKQLFHYWRNLKGAQKVVVQLLCDFDGNGYRWWEIRYSTTVSPQGGVRTAGLLLDIQDMKNREKELEDARHLAEKAELKQSFLANMSHEIRTPLNAIVGFSNILAASEDIDEEDKREYIDTINRNSELLLQLINDILELSRLESGQMSFEFENCTVADLLNDVYRTHQVLIPSRLQFLKDMDEVNPVIFVDKGRLTQVITNFINNACKFTKSGYIKLGYRWLPEENEVCIFVEDSGRGIAPEEQRMIFSRFYKEDEFAQGTGLGLSICEIIIVKLGGRIELRSEVGKGSCFSAVLPCVNNAPTGVN